MTQIQARTASELITNDVTSWPGVEAGPGSRGAFSFTLGRRELGHLHGDHVLHLGFPKDVWQELYAAGRIDYHPVFPGKPGYASRRLDTADDVRDAIALLRINYDRAVAHHGLPDPG
jgi:hypothetical protein